MNEKIMSIFAKGSIFFVKRINGMKDKSIKSTMKGWIMLSDKELDDTGLHERTGRREYRIHIRRQGRYSS